MLVLQLWIESIDIQYTRLRSAEFLSEYICGEQSDDQILTNVDYC